jgi:hypothetical protein
MFERRAVATRFRCVTIAVPVWHAIVATPFRRPAVAMLFSRAVVAMPFWHAVVATHPNAVDPACHGDWLYHWSPAVLRHTGRAAAEIGWILHHVCHFLLTVAVLLTLATVAGAWRLAQGPVDLDFFKNRIETAVNNSIAPARVTIGAASIAWAGFSHGLDQPLHLRVTDLTVDEPGGAGAVHIPIVEAALSARWMLIGRILPRSITLQGAHLLLLRNADGSLSFDIGGANEGTTRSPLTGLVAILAAPRQTDLQAGGRRLSQLSEVSIHAATLLLDDRRLGLTWSADTADIDLLRHKGGGMDGRATLALALSGQRVVLTSNFHLAPAARSVHVEANLSRVTPKAFAGSAPILASLAAVDVPLTLSGEADLGPDLTPTQIRVTAQAGAGQVMTDAGSIPIHSGAFTAAGTLEKAALEHAVVELQPASGAAISTVAASGQLTHQAGHLGAALHVTLDHLGFADLPAFWPADLAADARDWITQNIQTGTAHDGKFDLLLDTPDTTPDVTLLNATGTLDGDGVAVTWMPKVPRVEQAKAHLVLTDPDKLEIDVRAAHQVVRAADPIAIPYAHVTIIGLAKKDQFATVQCEADGPIASAVALLKEPGVKLLDRHPVDLRAPSGDARVTIHAMIPLEKKLLIDDVALHATASLGKAHLSGIVAGHDLDDGALLLDVDTNHLSVKGTGRLAGIAANIDGIMDFHGGPPTQVLQRFQATGRANAQQLTDAGLDTAGALAGDVGVTAVLSEYRSGDGEVIADADLTQAELNVAPLAWRKPVGGAAKASARLVLSKDRLVSIGPVSVDGAGIQVMGAVTLSDGKPDTIRLDNVVLGRTDVRGTIRLPPNAPIGVDLTGPSLDVAAKLQEKSPKRDPAALPPPPGPAWSMRGRFDRVYLAHDQIANQVMASGESDGRAIRDLAITGKIGAGKPFAFRIAQDPVATGPARGRTVRRLSINAQDAGSFLQGMGITGEIKGGALLIGGEFDDATPRHSLSGTLEISDFRVSNAPALGKLLQAVTLYGLLDALGGPGLRFDRLTAPFQFDDDTLVLRDARAFSPSLGLTAKGRIDRADDRLDLEGTVVPAYVFNSVLGRIPVIGRLFSVEKGGGVFAMNYSLSGPMDNPTVVANPLSVLTPGILRGMFGLFDRGPAESQVAPNIQTPLDRPATAGNVQSQ